MIPKKDGNILEILQKNMNSSSMDEVIRLVRERIDQNKKTFITTPNPEFIIYAQNNPWFKKILMQSDIAISDGVALLWAEEVLKKNNPFSRLLVGFLTGLKVIFTGWGKKRITGTDLMEKLCQLAAKNGWSVYFLGGKEGIAQKALKKLQSKYKGLMGGANSGPQLEIRNSKLIGNSQFEIGKLVDEINDKQPTFLFVAFGMGKQEKFIFDNWSKLKVKLAMGIGGAFDYLSGEVKRAPQWVQNMGFEWFYRLIKEPWRWKRQLGLLNFIGLVLKGE